MLLRLRVEAQGSAIWVMERRRTGHSEAMAKAKALPWEGASYPQGNEKDLGRDMTLSKARNKTMR